jgi:hypothetical protein
MSPKSIIMIAMVFGSTLGSCIPLLWGGSCFSFMAVVLGGIGGMAGIWFGVRLSR